LYIGVFTGEEGTDHAADAVKLEDVHAFVYAKPLVDVLAEGADGCCQEANESSDPEGDVSSGGGNTNETSDGA
jgi:hypothetical protein